MSDGILGVVLGAAARPSGRKGAGDDDPTAEHNDYRSVFEASPQPMWVFDVATGRVLAANGAALRRYRYSSGQFLALDAADLVVADQEFRTVDYKTARPSQLDGVGEHRASDGTIFPVSVTSSAVTFAGRVATLVLVAEIPGAAVPGTEDSRLNEELRLVLESSGEGIYSIDSRGLCVFANAAVSRMTGYDLDHLVGRNLHELLHHSHLDGGEYRVEDCPIYQVLQTGRPSRVDNEVLWRAWW